MKVLQGQFAKGTDCRRDKVTLKELSQLYNLNREIKIYEQRIKELENLAEGTTQNITGMPAAGNVNDKVGQIATDIAYYKSQIELNKQKCWNELNRLNTYIQGIDDSLTRQIFTLRFINGFTWEQVASDIGSSEYAIKQICYRYIKRH